MVGGKTVKKQTKSKKNVEKKPLTRRQKLAEKEAEKKAMVDRELGKQNEKVENIALLETKLGMSKIDALVAYDKFHKKYTEGEIKREEFMEENKVGYLKGVFIHTNKYKMFRKILWQKHSFGFSMKTTAEH